MNYVTEFAWDAFLAEIDSPPLTKKGSSHEDDPKGAFFGTATYQEAVDMIRNGWPEGAARLEPALAALNPKIASALEQIDYYLNDEATGELDIGAYLDGESEVWVTPRTELVAEEGRLIHIAVNNTVDGMRSAEDIWTHGAAIAALIHALEGAGHTCKLTVANVTKNDGSVSGIYVTVKDFGEPIALGRLIFALGHIAMLRRLFWRLKDRRPTEERCRMGFGDGTGGYGSPTTLSAARGGPRADIEVQQIIAGSPAVIQAWVLSELEKQGVALVK